MIRFFFLILFFTFSTFFANAFGAEDPTLDELHKRIKGSKAKAKDSKKGEGGEKEEKKDSDNDEEATPQKKIGYGVEFDFWASHLESRKHIHPLFYRMIVSLGFKFPIWKPTRNNSLFIEGRLVQRTVRQLNLMLDAPTVQLGIRYRYGSVQGTMFEVSLLGEIGFYRFEEPSDHKDGDAYAIESDLYGQIGGIFFVDINQRWGIGGNKAITDFPLGYNEATLLGGFRIPISQYGSLKIGMGGHYAEKFLGVADNPNQWHLKFSIRADFRIRHFSLFLEAAWLESSNFRNAFGKSDSLFDTEADGLGYFKGGICLYF